MSNRTRPLIVLVLLSLSSSALALGPQPPDQVDVFFQTNVRPQIELLLDTSCSMADDAGVTTCPYYETTFGVSPGDMNAKHHQLRASLVGCSRSDDGVIDRWASRVNFAIRGFDDGTPSVWRAFGSTADALETAIRPDSPSSFRLGGGTSMTLGLAEAGRDFGVFNDGNTLSCRPNIVLLLSDGNPNSSGGTFNYECADPQPPDEKRYRAGEPWCGAGYLAGSTDPACDLTTAYSDMVCGVGGDQEIHTYTIGFGRAGTFSPSNLQRIAANGKGQYFFASNVSALDAAFNEIITSVANRPLVTYAPPAVTLDGVFSGNRAFSVSFRPAATGFWAGNIKVSCLLPGLSATGDFGTETGCYYQRDPADPKQLIANATPIDLFTTTAVADARVGGAGQLLRNRLSTTPGGSIPRAPFYPRTIRTWRPGTPTLFDVRADQLTPDDLFLHGIERVKAINRLHGYTFDSDISDTDALEDDVSGLDPSDSNPVGVAAWPLADTFNSSLSILSYSPSIQYLIAPMNDGMLHAFESASGRETSALMMGETLKPHPALNFSIRDAMAMFNDTVRHPYLLDGGSRLFHEDTNANGFIESTERAYLFTGLGRAGAGYYMTNLSTFNGVFDASTNPVYPLLRQAGTHYQDLGDTWAAPWLGRMRVAGSSRRVAVFGSGHERGFDEPASNIPSALPGEWQISAPQFRPCLSLFTIAECTSIDMGLPIDLTLGPISIPNAIAYRLRFSTYAMSPGDEFRVQSGEGSTAEVLRGPLAFGYTSQWIYDDQAAVQAVTDGVAAAGLTVIAGVDYRTAEQLPARRRSPSIFVVDIDRWNGTAGPVPFADTTSDGGMLLRFTADCGGRDLGTRCFDASYYPDLRTMRCPISAEVSVLDAGGLLERAYVGDECGQIWRMSRDPRAADRWAVDRVFNANSDGGFPAAWPAASAVNVRNVRKFHRRIDLVRTKCAGTNAIGLYFGTGNSQRPTARDERGDVIGVVWDDGSIDENTGLGNLTNVSATDQIVPQTIAAAGRKGWFLNLRANERMLRDPVTFARVSYFKTFRPVTASSECVPGSGEDTVWSFDSCTAEAYNDRDGDGVREAGERIAQSTAGDIGASPSIVATRDTAVVISDQGSLNKRQSFDFRRARLLNWRGSK